MQKIYGRLFLPLTTLSLLFTTSCLQNKEMAYVDDNNDFYIPLPNKIKHPKNNIPNPDKEKLGKLLFYDPILSGNKDVACATCHHPEFGYAEPLDLSIGANGEGLGYNRTFKTPNNIPHVKRNAHIILNAAYNGIDKKGNYTPSKSPMFWDSRAQSLEEQALLPITTLEEMRGEYFSEEIILDTIVQRLKQIPEYVNLFQKAFSKSQSISEENIAKAIASFERTLITPNSRFDNYLNGDKNALSKGELEGFNLFKKAKCNNCHNGPMFSDYKTHVLGMIDNEKLKSVDSGENNSFAFRTPTLRNLRYTAPYMHNGKLKTLLEVLEFYEDITSGNSKNPHVASTQIDSLVKGSPLKVKDMAPIISFFNSLNSDNFDKTIPTEVPSKLDVGGNIH